MTCKEVNAWQSGISSGSLPCDDAIAAASKEKIIATQGQTLFSLLDFEYVINSDSFTVHRNGLLVDIDNVIELSPNTFWIQNEVVNEGDIIIAESISGVSTRLDVTGNNNSAYNAILNDGQTVIIVPADIPIATAAVYISGPDADDTRLIKNVHYSENNTNNTITLVESYPAGSLLSLIYSDPAIADGVSGSYTTADSKTVTVINGVITDISPL